MTLLLASFIDAYNCSLGVSTVLTGVVLFTLPPLVPPPPVVGLVVGLGLFLWKTISAALLKSPLLSATADCALGEL